MSAEICLSSATRTWHIRPGRLLHSRIHRRPGAPLANVHYSLRTASGRYAACAFAVTLSHDVGRTRVCPAGSAILEQDSNARWMTGSSTYPPITY